MRAVKEQAVRGRSAWAQGAQRAAASAALPDMGTAVGEKTRLRRPAGLRLGHLRAALQLRAALRARAASARRRSARGATRRAAAARTRLSSCAHSAALVLFSACACIRSCIASSSASAVRHAAT
jgi:hypothetical protein